METGILMMNLQARWCPARILESRAAGYVVGLETCLAYYGARMPRMLYDTSGLCFTNEKKCMLLFSEARPLSAYLKRLLLEAGTARPYYIPQPTHY